MSRDGTKVLVRQGGAYQLYDAKPKATEKKTVSTAGLEVDRVPAEEWAEIFDEVWRRYRDFFYVANMHGYDWKAIGERYRTLLPDVAHRSDLNYVLGEMVAELNVGHAYIAGGDFQLPERPKVGLPGARFALDRAAGPLPHRPDLPRRQRGGEVPLAARPRSASTPATATTCWRSTASSSTATDNPYRLLRHKTDPVTLTLNAKPTLRGRAQGHLPADRRRGQPALPRLGARATGSGSPTATDGRVGYLHIPDMGAPGIYEFIKWYYPQIRKEGLVVDVRSNGGGNVSQWIIERLDTKLLGTRFGRASDAAADLPDTVFHGHMVCLLNETSASDGDIFPALLPEGRARAADRQALVGRRRRHHGHRAADRRRHRLRAAAGDQRRRRQLHHRGPRRRPRHRGRERPGVGDRRPRPAARARRSPRC